MEFVLRSFYDDAMPPPRSFPPPWTVTEFEENAFFVVRHTGGTDGF